MLDPYDDNVLSVHFQQLDFWHPLEKLQYPDYFARREKRKQEFVERATSRCGPIQPAWYRSVVELQSLVNQRRHVCRRRRAVSRRELVVS
ncbi:hypothetical protein PHET_06213 [Paragonimus heterotremus]|uniref:Uncharacterized protein n=1 Tax=Paragonimus heterotremus TaxID=100268 RepID=A0A8J4WHL3_9TREM|nr:hypothetical protein PHET_06213 [Paragonimus heterotremus]